MPKAFSAPLLSKIVRAIVRETTATWDVPGRLDAEDTQDAVDSERNLGFRTQAAEVEIPGYGDWIITPDGEGLAEEKVAQDLEYEPEIFTQSWLAGHMTMSPTDMRIVAAEEADSAAEGLDASDLEDEIDAVAAVVKALKALTTAEDAVTSYDGDDGEHMDTLNIAYVEADDAHDEAREDALDEAREDWAGERAEEVEAELKRDALGYFEDIYGEGQYPKNLFSLDTDAAAEDAVNTDGAAHFLSSYDGDVTEVEVNGVLYQCYRTN